MCFQLNATEKLEESENIKDRLTNSLFRFVLHALALDDTGPSPSNAGNIKASSRIPAAASHCSDTEENGLLFQRQRRWKTTRWPRLGGIMIDVRKKWGVKNQHDSQRWHIKSETDWTSSKLARGLIQKSLLNLFECSKSSFELGHRMQHDVGRSNNHFTAPSFISHWTFSWIGTGICVCSFIQRDLNNC